MSEKAKPLTVYTIIEAASKKPFWKNIGVAWVNRDGSLNVDLDALPLNGKLHIREAKAKEATGEGQDPADPNG